MITLAASKNDYLADLIAGFLTFYTLLRLSDEKLQSCCKMLAFFKVIFRESFVDLLSSNVI